MARRGTREINGRGKKHTGNGRAVFLLLVDAVSFGRHGLALFSLEDAVRSPGLEASLVLFGKDDGVVVGLLVHGDVVFLRDFGVCGQVVEDDFHLAVFLVLGFLVVEAQASNLDLLVVTHVGPRLPQPFGDLGQPDLGVVC